jgi:hypothetical protein
MQRFVVGIIAVAVLTSMARNVGAQARTVSSEMKVETATVEAIEASSRTITLKKPDGTFVTVVAGRDVKRFGEIKIGDKVNARYYENVVVRLKQPGEPEVDSGAKATTSPEQVLPGGTTARQRTITATIAAIDMTTPSITFTGPNGWKYSSKVQDKSALAKVKVGDKVEIVWTEAVLVSVEPGA